MTVFIVAVGIPNCFLKEIAVAGILWMSEFLLCFLHVHIVSLSAFDRKSFLLLICVSELIVMSLMESFSV